MARLTSNQLDGVRLPGELLGRRQTVVQITKKEFYDPSVSYWNTGAYPRSLMPAHGAVRKRE